MLAGCYTSWLRLLLACSLACGKLLWQRFDARWKLAEGSTSHCPTPAQEDASGVDGATGRFLHSFPAASAVGHRAPVSSPVTRIAPARPKGKAPPPPPPRGKAP